MSKIHLSLDPDDRTDPPSDEDRRWAGEEGPPAGCNGAHRKRERSPVLGWFAVGFGILSVFAWSLLFVPLALLCGIIALFVGQVFWGLSAIALALIGILTSPIWMMLLGLGALAAFMQHMLVPMMM